jgi:hypothetical protein
MRREGPGRPFRDAGQADLRADTAEITDQARAARIRAVNRDLAWGRSYTISVQAGRDRPDLATDVRAVIGRQQWTGST